MRSRAVTAAREGAWGRCLRDASSKSAARFGILSEGRTPRIVTKSSNKGRSNRK